MEEESCIVSTGAEQDPDRSILIEARNRILSTEGQNAQLKIEETLGEQSSPESILVTGPQDKLESLLSDLKSKVWITPNVRTNLFSPINNIMAKANNPSKKTDQPAVDQPKPEAAPAAVNDQPAADKPNADAAPAAVNVGTDQPAADQPGNDAAPSVAVVNELSEPRGEFIFAPKDSAGQAGVQRFADGGGTLIHQLRTFSGIDIEVIDRIQSGTGALTTFSGGGTGPVESLLVKIDPAKGKILEFESLTGRIPDMWVIENLKYDLLRPSVLPFNARPPEALFDTGSTVQVDIQVIGEGDKELPDANVTIHFSNGSFPINAVTDPNGVASLRVPSSTLSSIPAIVVEPRSMHWNRVIRNAAVSQGKLNRVRVKSFSEFDSNFKTKGVFSWGVEQLGITSQSQLTGRGIKIGIIDSGCDIAHNLLGHVARGNDFNPSANQNSWGRDDDGHGTHVAGVIAARAQGTGMPYRGIAPEAEIYIYKVFPDGRFFTIEKAVMQAIADGVDVLNMSLGSPNGDPKLAEQIQKARNAGIACIIAAGNSSDEVKFPAYLDSAIAITAIGSNKVIPPDSAHANQILSNLISPDGIFSPYFTCLGNSADFAAPGVGIISTYPNNGFKALDGTSMAAPHVAGLAALFLAHDPALANLPRDANRVNLLVQRMRMSAQQLPFGLQRSGAGFPKLPQALAFAAQSVGMMGGASPFGSPLGTGMQPKKNQFLVDLSKLELTDVQNISVESAINKAVTTELLHLQPHLNGKINLVPLSKEASPMGLGGHTAGLRML